MPLFSQQKVFCGACGKEFLTLLHYKQWFTCSMDCYKELEWRTTLSIMGKPYKSDPKNAVAEVTDNTVKCEKEIDHDFESSGQCKKCGAHRPPYMPNCS